MIGEEVGMGHMYIGKYLHEEFLGTYIVRMFWVEQKQLHGNLDPIGHIGWTVA